jgi:hypothetical protein
MAIDQSSIIQFQQKSYSPDVLTYPQNCSGLKHQAMADPLDVFKKLGAFFVSETNCADGTGMVFLKSNKQCIFIMLGVGQVK